jgi:hypothetical protein
MPHGACRCRAYKIGGLLRRRSGRPVFAVDCEPLEMPSLNTPPSSPILKGAEQESIWVKYEVEVTHEQVWIT